MSAHDEDPSPAGLARAPSSRRSTSTVDARALAAWRAWLSTMATEPDAAIAASMTYAALDGEGRDAWLDALDEDGPRIGVPALALYAPLLASEVDDNRRQRIARALGEGGRIDLSEVTARHGFSGDGRRACVLVARVYHHFVSVLLCLYRLDTGFLRAECEPFRRDDSVPDMPLVIDGIALDDAPAHVVIDELAHAVLAELRARRRPPAALEPFAHLFAVQAEASP